MGYVEYSMLLWYKDNGSIEKKCYYSFSSKCNMINVDKDNNISSKSTLIDIYKKEM